MFTKLMIEFHIFLIKIKTPEIGCLIFGHEWYYPTAGVKFCKHCRKRERIKSLNIRRMNMGDLEKETVETETVEKEFETENANDDNSNDDSDDDSDE